VTPPDLDPDSPRPAARTIGTAPARRSPLSWFSIGFQFSLGAVIAYLLIQAVESLEDILLLVLLALVIAISIDPLVRQLVARAMPRRWAVGVVTIALVLVLGALSALFIAPVVNEVGALSHSIPVWLQQLHDHHSALGRLEDRYHVVEKANQELSSSGTVDGLLGAGQLVITTVTGLFLVATLTLYFLAGLPALKAFCLRFVPGSKRPHTKELADEILLRTGRYMLANVATSVIAGVATFVWLEVFGVPYPAALGVLVAVMDMIPLVGSTIGGIIVSLVALVVSWPVALATAAFYVVFRVAEDYLITPRAMKYAVAVHPLVTILGVIAGGALFGIVGALLAIPVAVAIGLVLDDAVFPGIDTR
jgi:predicted PurR-regulated permease PerM